jgi:CubicO group peptidase (beta-lactamase class C family)
MLRRVRGIAWPACALVMLLSPGPGVGADPAPAAVAAPRDVSLLLAPIVAKHDVPALCAGVVVDSRLVLAGVDGLRRRGFPERATLDDRWHLGSCTKAMTATLCVLLEGAPLEGAPLKGAPPEGRPRDGGAKLALGTTLEAALGTKALEGLGADRGWYGVTVEQLLRHRGGAPANLDVGGLWGRLWQRQGTPREQRQELLAGLLPQARGPEGYVYSNAGYALAGIVCERVADTDYETLIQERLFTPLGITSAGFGSPGVPERFDQPRGHDKQGKPVEPGPRADNPPAVAPAGTAHMTLADWGRFVGLHLEAEARGTKLLTQEQARRLHTPPPGVEPAYAAGWMVTERPWGGRVLTHGGTNTMWTCVTWLAPAKGFAVLVCCNQGGDRGGAACDAAAWALIQEHLRAPTPEAPRTSR